MLTYGSLFTGIGGFDLGFDRCGFSCKWQVEIDDYATRVLERHWPQVERWRDIRDFIADCTGGRSVSELRANVLPAEMEKHQVDIICGGFPCQPVSLAGNRGGSNDDRWMWPEFRQVVDIFRPSFVVAENVPGLLSAESGRLFGTMLRDLASCGYDAEWHCLPAGAFNLPHLRWRVFIVAYQKGLAACSSTTPDSGESRLPTSEREVVRGEGRREEGGTTTQCDWRSVEPCIRRGTHGVSNRVDRIRCLGNAVVPQIAEWIGNQIKVGVNHGK